MSVETVDDKKFDLAEHAMAKRLYLEWLVAKKNAAQAKKAMDQLREQLDRELGDATRIFDGDRQLYKYENDGAFNTARFLTEMPHIAEKYQKWEAVQVFDQDRFAEENEALYTQYRTRQMREIKEK